MGLGSSSFEKRFFDGSRIFLVIDYCNKEKSVYHFDHEMHLPTKGKRRRYGYGSTKQAKFRSNIESFACKIPFCIKEEKIVF